MTEDTKKDIVEVKNEAGARKPKATAKPKSKSENKVPVVSPPKAPRVKKISFTQWAKRRGIKNHHMSGLKAYVDNPSKRRILEDWDKCFKDY